MSRVDAAVPRLYELLDAITSGNVGLVETLAYSLREKINDSVTKTFYPPSSVEEDTSITSEHTTLGTAVEVGNLEMVKILVDVGAIPQADLLTDILNLCLRTNSRDVIDTLRPMNQKCDEELLLLFRKAMTTKLKSKISEILKIC